MRWESLIPVLTYSSRQCFVHALLADDDGEEDDEDSGVYRLQWFLESCSDGRTSLGEVPLVAMSATTQVAVVR